jgi:cytochrome c oxidase assembly protein subunit 15
VLGLVFALLWCQVALGGWVSTNYAVLACTDFPTCQGSWWPAMNFHDGFYLWRELGAGRRGDNIPFDALTAIHYVHRLMAYAVFAALGWLAWRLWSTPGLRRTAGWILALAGWQLLTGLSNVLLDWPLLGAVGHTGGAAGLVLVLTGALFGTRSVRDPVSTASFNVTRLSP